MPTAQRGLRAGLARRGLTFELLLQVDHSTALSGGLGRGSALRRPLANRAWDALGSNPLHRGQPSPGGYQ